MSRRSKLDEKMNKEAISFLKKFLKSLISGKFQVVTWGWWPAGQNGKYGLSLYWNSVDEVTDEE